MTDQAHDARGRPSAARAAVAAAWAVPVLAALLAGFAAAADMRVVGDEAHHHHQTALFLTGHVELSPRLETWPGYHFTLSAMGTVFGSEPVATLPELRACSLVLSALLLPAFFALALAVRASAAPLRTVQLFALPVVFPCFFLLRPDLLSAALVLTGIALALRRQVLASGLLLTLSLAVGAENLSWLVMTWIPCAVSVAGDRERGWVLRVVERTWSFALGAVAGGAGLLLGRGADHGTVGPGGLPLANLSLLLLVAFVLFLPLHVLNVPRVGDALRRRPWSAAGLVVLFGVHWLAFRADVTGPAASASLHDRLLTALEGNAALRLATFVPVAWAAASLAVTPLTQRRAWWLWPATLVFLLPLGRIDPGHAIVPLALFLALRERRSTTHEVALLLAWGAVSALILRGVTSGAFAP